MYTLDTNAIIYHLGGDAGVRMRIESAFVRMAPVYVSAVTIAELLRFSALSAEEAENIQTFLLACSVINLDASLAMHAGAIGREHGLKLADSIIAAAALFTGSTLLTRNVRDFKRVPNLSVEAI